MARAYETRTTWGVLLLLGGALLACKQGAKPEGASSATPAVGAEPPAATNEVTFRRKVPPPGYKARSSQSMSMKFTLQGKVFRQGSALNGTLEVKSADDFRITRAVLQIDEMYETSQEGTGAEKKTVSPLAGSSYTVTRYDDGSLGAQDASGNKVAPSVLKILKDEFGRMFEKSKESAFLPDRPVKLDEKLTPPSDAMLAMMGLKDDADTQVDGIELLVKAIAPEKVTFDTTMTLTQKVPGGLRLRVKMKGKIEMKPDGAWLVGVDLSGPITILDSKGDEKGSGEFSVRVTQTPL